MTFHFSRRLYLNPYRIQRVMAWRKFQNFSYTPGCQLVDLNWWLQTKNMPGCNPAFISVRHLTRIHTILDMRILHKNVSYAVFYMAVTAFLLITWSNSAGDLCNVLPFSPSWWFFEDLDAKTNGPPSIHPISLPTSSTISHFPQYSFFLNE
jgi:hypothetical protein